jgi:hypothetical protein
MAWDDDIRSVRLGIYQSIVDSGVAPSPRGVARGCGISDARVETMFRALADAHVIVLRSESTVLWAAPPFSAISTGFAVSARGKSWFAPCAWDAFGIPAALHADADIDAVCAQTGEAIRCGVRDGRAFGSAVIHLLVPAAHFWDDIVYT